MRGLRHRVHAQTLRAPGIAGSVALHALVVATFLLAGGLKTPAALPPVYRVTLIAPLGTPAPPAAAPAPARVPAATPKLPAAHALRPAPSRSRAPAVPLKPVAKPAASPAPAAPRTAHAAPAAARPAATTPPARSPAAAAGSPEGEPGGTSPTTIRTEGVEFPFPGYLDNLVAQVYQRWRPPPSNARLHAEVFFLVHRDGSVTGLQFIQRSGSFAFDLEAQGAVEAAGRAGAFGPLPAGYGADVLPVSFFFNPGAPR